MAWREKKNIEKEKEREKRGEKKKILIFEVKEVYILALSCLVAAWMGLSL